MFQRPRISPLFLVLSIALFLFISPVNAQDVDFPDFPQALADATNISLFASEILCSIIFMFMWLLPLNATKRGSGLIPNLIIGLGLLGFCVAIGWFPFWILLLLCLLIATMWSNKIKNLFGG